MGLREALTAVPTWARWLLALLPLRIALIPAIPILPEEAYHWNYARHLDWGYYDHPPMIAWAIAAGRSVFGDNAFGIRAVPLLFSVGTSVLLARLADRFYGGAAAVWAVVLSSVAPVAMLASEAGFPDAPLFFFWTLTLRLAWDAIEGRSGRRWLAAGAALGAALLSKYTAVLLVPSVLFYLVRSERDRRWLATPWPYLGGLMAIVVFLPVVHWNWTHEWASFLFQSRGRFEDGPVFNPVSALRFLWTQALAVFPLTLPLAAVTVVRLDRSPRPEEQYLRASLLPIVLLFWAMSWFRSTHILWSVPGYLGLTVAMAGVAAESEGKVARFYGRWRRGIVAVSFAVLLVAGLHLAFFLPWLSPLQGVYGWKEVAARARAERASLPSSAFILGIGRRYTCTSQLAYHLNLPYEVHGKHLIGDPDALQYQYWSSHEALQGRDAVIVIEQDQLYAALVRLQDRFLTLEPAGTLVVPVGRRPIREAPPLTVHFFRGRGYRPMLAAQ